MENPAAFPLPLKFEEISAEWLTAALRTRAPDVTVHACEIVDVKRGTSTKIRVRLKLDEAGVRAGIPDSVIVKGGFETHSRDMAPMYEQEVLGYQHIVHALGLPAPRCYFAEYDPERQQGIVILEDLVSSGVTFCDPLKAPSMLEAERRLSVLARFHARSWESPRFKPGGQWSWLREVNSMTRAYAGPYLEPDRWNSFMALPRGAAVSVRFHDREWMVEALDRLSEFAAQGPHCVLHSDTHVGNTYIAADGTPGFFDALPTYGPSMVEVTYNLACALDSADRPNWEGPLIRHYLRELEDCGVAAPSFDEAMRQYGIYLARAYFIFVINESHYQYESVNTAFSARISCAMIDHDTKSLIESI